MKEVPYYRSRMQDELANRCAKNSRYSLRAFARALDIEATVISQIMSAKRIPSFKTAQRVTCALGLPPDEIEQFNASLAETHRARNLERLNPYFRKLESQPAPKRELSLDLFRVIADWYHYAILALSQTRDFKSNISWIAKSLSISATEAKLAIERLLSLGFLVEDRNGNLKSSTEGFTTADKQMTDAALCRRQKQILEKSIESLENDAISVRSHTSMTMAIDPEKLAQAKEMIECFTQKLSKYLESGNRTQVYELGISLYPLQKKRSQKCN